MKLFFFNESTIGVFYLEVTNDKYKIIGMALNEYKNVFLNIDITEEMISLEQIQQIELLYDYNAEHNILIVSFGKKYLYYLKIKPFMFAKQFDQWNPKKIKLNIFEQEKEIFKKIIYDHQDQIIYIVLLFILINISYSIIKNYHYLQIIQIIQKLSIMCIRKFLIQAQNAFSRYEKSREQIKQN